MNQIFKVTPREQKMPEVNVTIATVGPCALYKQTERRQTFRRWLGGRRAVREKVLNSQDGTNWPGGRQIARRARAVTRASIEQ